ncbi:retrovirus-related pol polyprotein from transposon TNT 1-94 [Tanacetum coccineum]
MSNPTSKPSDASLVKIEAPKVSLVNESLKRLKFHLVRFDNVVKIRTTPDARTEVDKQCLEIAKKELFLENDRLLQQIMSQDVLLTVMKSMSLIGESVNMDGKRKETCNLEAELLKSQNAFNDLLKSYSQLEKHCMFKLDLEPLAPRLLQNREAHINYLKYTQEQADILRGIVEQAKAKQPLDKELDFACKHAQLIQGLLVYVQDTCSNAIKLNEKKVVVAPKNKVKKVRFVEPLTSSGNIKHVESSKTSDSNTPVLSSTGLNCSTSKYGSNPTGNKKNDRISRTPSRNMKNKVEAQPRKVNKKNSVVEPIRVVDVKHSLLNANSEPICATCKKSMFDGVHDMCLLDFVENVNSHAKSAKKHKKQNIWKPTGFTEVKLKWKPTGRTFTIVGNSCLLTRITSAKVVPPKKTTSDSVETQKPELKVYHRKPKNIKNVGSSKKSKIVESKNAKHSEPNHTWGSNATDIPSSSSLVMTSCPDCTVRFRNDNIARIMGYGDYQLGNVTISRKNTCFIRNLEGVDLLSGSRDTNLYTISLDDMLQKDHLCSACALGKSRNPFINPKLKTLARKNYIFCIWIGVAQCVWRVLTGKDNGTEFVNQTLHEFYENVSISHQTSVARTPQQNGVAERRK